MKGGEHRLALLLRLLHYRCRAVRDSGGIIMLRGSRARRRRLQVAIVEELAEENEIR
ncbi:fatty acid elongase, putative [Leishmania tarentolae]|uniref:Fatty acid elongase, putative n=1 Tax=Leishmania tarentolae TaxID=5689 RepID=A0A640KBN1_LEITA|nr:fatty acid elongase, putative [Leishmania tarentolae]GET87096.1 fatty acid elongase, putative [Leishmania tarentolae]